MPPLPRDQQDHIAELAVNVIELFDSKGQKVAYDRVKGEGLDNEQTIYLWAQLPSNVRSGLKLERGLRNGAA